MTNMDFCVLQHNNKLYCGIAHDFYISRIISNLKPSMKTAMDVINGTNNAPYPWNFPEDHGTGSLRMNKDSFEMYHEYKGVPLDGITPQKAVRNASGILFVDLKEKKIVHISHSSPRPPKFLETELSAYDRGYTTRFTRPMPKGFIPISINLEKEVRDAQGVGNVSDPARFNRLFHTLKRCQHPSGEFYRSVGACLTKNLD